MMEFKSEVFDYIITPLKIKRYLVKQVLCSDHILIVVNVDLSYNDNEKKGNIIER